MKYIIDTDKGTMLDPILVSLSQYLIDNGWTKGPRYSAGSTVLANEIEAWMERRWLTVTEADRR
jgi:hypothetical protein